MDTLPEFRKKSGRRSFLFYVVQCHHSLYFSAYMPFFSAFPQ